MKEIIIPILNDEYKTVFTYGTPEEIKKVLKKYYYPMDQVHEEHFEGRGVCFYHPGCYPIMAMPGFPKTAEEMGTLAHEAVHAVNDIFGKIGEDGCGEVFAHSVSAIVEKVLTEGKKKKWK